MAKTHVFLKNAGITNKYYDEIMMKVDFDRSKYETIVNMVSQMGKHHQVHPDDNQGHILLTQFEEEQYEYKDPVPIEYFTDCAGSWYIWDWDLDAGYYLDLSEEEYNNFYQDTLVYWDQCKDEQDYEEWEAYETA